MAEKETVIVDNHEPEAQPRSTGIGPGLVIALVILVLIILFLLFGGLGWLGHNSPTGTSTSNPAPSSSAPAPSTKSPY